MLKVEFVTVTCRSSQLGYDVPRAGAPKLTCRLVLNITANSGIATACGSQAQTRPNTAGSTSNHLQLLTHLGVQKATEDYNGLIQRNRFRI